MTKIGKSVIVLIIFILIAVSVSYAENEAAEQLLERGLTLFRTGQYEDALLIFTELANLEVDNPYLEESLFMIAKSNIRLGRYDDVLRGTSYFIAAFPESIYADDMIFMLAEIFYFLGDDAKAFSKLFRLLEDDVDPKLRGIVDIKVRKLLGRIDRAEIDRLYLSANEPGKKIIDEVLQYRGRFGKIAILTMPDDSSAEQVMQGVKVALEVFNKQSGSTDMVLDVIPIDEDYLGLFLKIKSLNKDNYGAVISLLNGAPSIIAAASASQTNTPFFILSDNSPDIWQIGDNIWQLVPDMRTMGAGLADFISDSLGLQRVVLLAAMDDSRSYFADAFLTEAKAKEIDIAAQEWYYTDALDLGKNFKMLRQLGFRCAFDDSLKQLIALDSLYLSLEDWEYRGEEYLMEINPPDTLDSVLEQTSNTTSYKVDTLYFSILGVDSIEIDSAEIIADRRLKEVLDKAWRVHQNDIIQKARFQRIAIDSTDIPLSCFDGFVFPLQKNEVDMFIPQFAFYNFKTSLFSLRSAFTPDNVDKYRQHLGGLKTVGWGDLRNYSSPAYSLMLKNFIEISDNAPSDEEVLGYDSANFILSILPDLYNLNGSVLTRQLKFTGVYHDFYFPKNIRGNRKVDFFEFNGRQFSRLSAKVNSSLEIIDNDYNE